MSNRTRSTPSNPAPAMVADPSASFFQHVVTARAAEETFLRDFGSNLEALGTCDSIPAEVAQIITDLKATVNGRLEQLPPLEQVESAQQAGYAIRWLQESLGRCYTEINRLKESMGEVMKRYTTAQTAACGTLQTQIDTLKTNTVPKADFDKAIADARKAGADEALAAVARRNARTAEVAKCGLAVPEDKVLDLPDVEFNAALARAKDQAGKITGRKLTLNGSLGGLPWLPKDQFEDRFQILADAIQSSGNGSCATPSRPTEPAAGGGSSATPAGGKPLMPCV